MLEGRLESPKISGRVTIRFCVASVVLLALSAICCAQDIGPKVDEYLNAYVKQQKFSGSVLIARGGSILISKGYGLANYEHGVPNTPQTKFRIGSVTKQFTSMAVMQLQEKGLLNTSDPITKYLPDYPKTGERITIHNLLTHTSGIPNLTSLPDFKEWMTMPASVGKVVARFKDLPLDFPPGEKFAYSNSNYVVLAWIIEKVSGKSYEECLAENIFRPLKMTNTGYDHAAMVLEHRASGYTMADEGLENAPYIDMSIPIGGGALYSTVEDLYLWDRALYTEKLVKRATLEKIFTPFKNSYGYAWLIIDLFKHKRITHGGSIQGFLSDVSRYVDDDLCIIVLSNFDHAPMGRIARDLAAIAFGEKYELPVQRVAIKVDPKLYDRYAGKYQLSPGPLLTITRDGDRLMAEYEGQSRITLYPESETKFFFKVIDSQVTFVKNAEGRVTELIFHRSNGQQLTAKKIE